MTPEKILIPEFKEIPTNFNTVVADDKMNLALETEQAIKEGFSSGPIIPGEIYKAVNAMDLFQHALIGNNGKQADVVLLDDNYEENFREWKPKDEDLSVLAEQAGIDFSPFKIPDRAGHTIMGVMPDDLHFPNSTNFAMLLRILGFKNDIFVVSGDPPWADAIKKEMDRLAEYTPHYKLVFPINGISKKEPDKWDKEIFYANSISEYNMWNKIRFKGNLSNALQKLFSNQPPLISK